MANRPNFREVSTFMVATTTLTISEQATGGGKPNQFSDISIPERITVRQLICLYIDHQIEQHRDKSKDSQRHSFFIPLEQEQSLSGTQPGDGKLNPEKLYSRALDAFSNNQFVLLVDDHQVEELEQDVFVTAKSNVTFLKLMPLIGG
jgi:hypothetical protein